jgi:hypothetical protein
MKLMLCSLSFFCMASCLGDIAPDETGANETNPVIEPVEQDEACCCTVKEYQHAIFLEEKASYFVPVNSKMRDIYAKGMGLYGFELSFPAWRYIYGWASGSYLTETGHSIGSNSRTRVTLVPLGIGVKFLYTVDWVDFYAGIGGLGAYLHTHDHSPFVIKSTSKWTPGGIIKIGAFIRPTECFFIDLFGDYSYMKFNFHGGSKKVVRHDVDFSGWSFGSGIGWLF